MSLIKCPECGKNVSEKAKVCPNCGYPMEDYVFNIIKKEDIQQENKEGNGVNRKLLLAIVIIGLVMAIGIVVGLFKRSGSGKASVNNAIYEKDYVGAVSLMKSKNINDKETVMKLIDSCEDTDAFERVGDYIDSLGNEDYSNVLVKRHIKYCYETGDFVGVQKMYENHPDKNDEEVKQMLKDAATMKAIQGKWTLTATKISLTQNNKKINLAGIYIDGWKAYYYHCNDYGEYEEVANTKLDILDGGIVYFNASGYQFDMELKSYAYMVVSNNNDSQLNGLGEWVVVETDSKDTEFVFRKQDFAN